MTKQHKAPPLLHFVKKPRNDGRDSSYCIGVLVLFILSTTFIGFAQNHNSLCSNGNNSFSMTLRDGARVELGPDKSGGLATRTCQATLMLHDAKLDVAHNAPEVDLDLFGAEMEGIGMVAAFQVKNSAEQCCLKYQIYSLTDAPHLVRTIDGGFFSAKDFDLDGRVEVWAEDAASVNGFEGLISTQFEFPPTLVLRFEDGRLLDATHEFASYFDEVITAVSAQIDSAVAQEFKQSDGKVAFSVKEIDKFKRLQKVKIQALEIVWAYLYSGREQEAWASLAKMWPEADLERIKSVIVRARKNGILAQVDGQSVEEKKHKKAKVFPGYQVQRPIAIRMWTPQIVSGMNEQLSKSDITLVLVIDSAGKVRTARIENTKIALSEEGRELLHIAGQWKFIPAMKVGHPVASRMETTVSLKK